jgi:pyridoxine/pyridoxamine 5'-phosphate oxidase
VDNPDEVAREIIDVNRYLTLATADETGRPWASPVWYAHADYREFFWVSKPEARHSRNLAARPEVGIVIFDSHVPGTGRSVYMEAAAEQIDNGDLERGMEIFNSRSVAQGLTVWALDDVRSPARHRLYHATVAAQFVLDSHDQRIPVQAGTG